jgi:hypothetical protein
MDVSVLKNPVATPYKCSNGMLTAQYPLRLLRWTLGAEKE